GVSASGALRASLGSNSWAGPVTLATDSSISVSLASDTTFIGGPITGSGGLTKSLAGTLILGASANGYTGATTILDGLLLIDGLDFASQVLLNGGTLGGVGLCGSIRNISTGAVSPGHSPGILSVNGDAILTNAVF